MATILWNVVLWEARLQHDGGEEIKELPCWIKQHGLMKWKTFIWMVHFDNTAADVVLAIVPLVGGTPFIVGNEEFYGKTKFWLRILIGFQKSCVTLTSVLQMLVVIIIF